MLGAFCLNDTKGSLAEKDLLAEKGLIIAKKNSASTLL